MKNYSKLLRFTRAIAPVLPLLWCTSTALLAQQVPQYSLYALNPYAHNPAYAGLENTLVLSGLYRQQWSGLLGAPTTQQINAHLPLYAVSSGVGMRLSNDVIGAHNTVQAVLSYNYQLQFSRNTVLSLGLSGGWLQYSLDGTKLRAPQGTYAEPNFSHNEAVLPLNKVQAGAPIVELGAFLSAGAMQIGISSQPVFAAKIKEKQNGILALQPVQHLFLYAVYQLTLAENLALKPSALLKSDFTETQMELSVMLRWRENMFAGTSYRGFGERNRDAVAVFIGFKANERTTLGYAYDFPLSTLSAANRGSHELLARYSLEKPVGVGKLPPLIYNPRFY